jgi:hypothetical protein
VRPTSGFGTNGPVGPVSRCPFIGVERTLCEWLTTSEFDPTETWQAVIVLGLVATGFTLHFPSPLMGRGWLREAKTGERSSSRGCRPLIRRGVRATSRKGRREEESAACLPPQQKDPAAAFRIPNHAKKKSPAVLAGPSLRVAARAVAGRPSQHQNLNWTPPLKMKPSIILDTVNGLDVSAAVVVTCVTPPPGIVPVFVVAVVWLPEPVVVVRTVPRL